MQQPRHPRGADAGIGVVKCYQFKLWASRAGAAPRWNNRMTAPLRQAKKHGSADVYKQLQLVNAACCHQFKCVTVGHTSKNTHMPYKNAKLKIMSLAKFFA
jgi:hypothetical protein